MKEAEINTRYVVDRKGAPAGSVQRVLDPLKNAEPQACSWKYFPSTNKPCLTATELREMADILDRRNAREKEAAIGPARSYD